MHTTASANNTAILTIILMMIVIDIPVVLTGLPKIHQELGFTDAGLAWVQSAYTLTFGGFLLLGGRVGDNLGCLPDVHRRRGDLHARLHRCWRLAIIGLLSWRIGVLLNLRSG